MKLKFFLALFVILSLSACHTMHFKKTALSPNQNVSALGQEFDSWHHVGILSLVEFSQPITRKDKGCSSWDSVTIQRGFLPGLVSSLPYVGWFYSPWDAYMKCS